jgi:hypothetical protein
MSVELLSSVPLGPVWPLRADADNRRLSQFTLTATEHYLLREA